MNLSAFAQQQGISSQTAWRRWRRVDLPTYQLPSGRVIGASPTTPHGLRPQQVAVSARFASAETRTNLDRRAERVVAFGAARGGRIAKVVKEGGSGVKDRHPHLLALLAETSLRHMVVEQNDRCSRGEVADLQTRSQMHGRDLVIINEADEGQGDVLSDVVALLTACCARRSGRRRARHMKTPLFAALEVN